MAATPLLDADLRRPGETGALRIDDFTHPIDPVRPSPSLDQVRSAFQLLLRHLHDGLVTYPPRHRLVLGRYRQVQSSKFRRDPDDPRPDAFLCLQLRCHTGCISKDMPGPTHPSLSLLDHCVSNLRFVFRASVHEGHKIAKPLLEYNRRETFHPRASLPRCRLEHVPCRSAAHAHRVPQHFAICCLELVDLCSRRLRERHRVSNLGRQHPSCEFSSQVMDAACPAVDLGGPPRHGRQCRPRLPRACFLIVRQPKVSHCITFSFLCDGYLSGF